MISGCTSSLPVVGDDASAIAADEFDGETSDHHEGDADSEALRDHVESNRNIGDRWGTMSDYSVSDEGRTLVLTGTVRTRALVQ